MCDSSESENCEGYVGDFDLIGADFEECFGGAFLGGRQACPACQMISQSLECATSSRQTQARLYTRSCLSLQASVFYQRL
jgi:hypothetical protein